MPVNKSNLGKDYQDRLVEGFVVVAIALGFRAMLSVRSRPALSSAMERYAQTVVWYGRKSNKFRHTDATVDVLD